MQEPGLVTGPFGWSKHCVCVERFGNRGPVQPLSQIGPVSSFQSLPYSSCSISPFTVVPLR
jgi:hypothetical protein